MPLESFHSLQEDWKLEIQHMFDDLRTKEKVKAGGTVGGMEQDPCISDAFGGAESLLLSPSLWVHAGLNGPFLRIKKGACWQINKKKAPCIDALTSDTA